MTIDEFIAAQQDVIADGGFEEYLPTLWVDRGRLVEVNVLTDPPKEVTGVEAAARGWASTVAGRCDYFLAFRRGACLKVVARRGGNVVEQLVGLGKE